LKIQRFLSTIIYILENKTRLNNFINIRILEQMLKYQKSNDGWDYEYTIRHIFINNMILKLNILSYRPVKN